MSRGDANKAAALTGLAWKEPKMRHRKLMRYLRKLEIPIIFCLRAEPKIKYVKDERGKTQVVDAGWLPIAEKLFGYDMLVYCLMMPENPGVPVHLKKLETEFESMFPLGKQVTESAGKMLSQWASGTEHAPPKISVSASHGQDSIPLPASQSSDGAAPTDKAQLLKNIETAPSKDVLEMAGGLISNAGLDANEILAFRAAYRKRLGELRAIADEVKQ